MSRVMFFLRYILALGLVVGSGFATPAANAGLVTELDNTEPLGVVLLPLVSFMPSSCETCARQRDAERGVLRALHRGIEIDPRFESAETAFEALADRDGAQLAREQINVGIGAYRAGRIYEAVEYLTSGIASGQRQLLGLSDPAFYSVALRTLAVAQLELQAVRGNDPRRRSRARAALVDRLIIDSDARFSPALHPDYLVSLQREAEADFESRSTTRGAWSAETLERARQLHGADVALGVSIFYHERSAVLILRAVDVRSGEDAWFESRTLARGDSLESAAADLMDAYLTCSGLERRPVDPRSDQGRGVWVGAAYEGAYFARVPSDASFYSHGPSFHVNWFFSDFAGVFVGSNLLYGRGDRNGDLLTQIEFMQINLGLTFSSNSGRVRPVFDTGVSIARRSGWSLTENFWCKVSGGEEREFGSPDRACRAADLERSKAGVLFGYFVDTGLRVRLVAPLWLSFRVGFDTYIAPRRNRSFDVPLSGELGLELRF